MPLWKGRGYDRAVRREEVLRQASDIIAGKRLFLNPELRFNDVVRAAGTNRTYLWDAMHSLGLGFRDYLARFRVVYFIEHAWLEEYRSLSNDDIAERCGFSSKKLLDRYLQKIIGISFSRYMEIVRRN